MRRTVRPIRAPDAGATAWVSVLASAPGCSPYVEVGGAYFPAWLICLLAGSAGSAVLRSVLVRRGLDSSIEPQVLAWPAIIVALSAACWLVFFSR